MFSSYVAKEHHGKWSTWLQNFSQKVELEYNQGTILIHSLLAPRFQNLYWPVSDYVYVIPLSDVSLFHHCMLDVCRIKKLVFNSDSWIEKKAWCWNYYSLTLPFWCHNSEVFWMPFWERIILFYIQEKENWIFVNKRVFSLFTLLSSKRFYTFLPVGIWLTVLLMAPYPTPLMLSLAIWLALPNLYI